MRNLWVVLNIHARSEEKLWFYCVRFKSSCSFLKFDLFVDCYHSGTSSDYYKSYHNDRLTVRWHWTTHSSWSKGQHSSDSICLIFWFVTENLPNLPATNIKKWHELQHSENITVVFYCGQRNKRVSAPCLFRSPTVYFFSKFREERTAVFFTANRIPISLSCVLC